MLLLIPTSDHVVLPRHSSDGVVVGSEVLQLCLCCPGVAVALSDVHNGVDEVVVLSPGPLDDLVVRPLLVDFRQLSRVAQLHEVVEDDTGHDDAVHCVRYFEQGRQ